MSAPTDETYPASYKPVFYTKVPETLHEKYIEAWFHFGGKGLVKKQAQALANEDWRNCSNDGKHELIRKHVKAIRKRKNNTLFSCGFQKKTKSAAAAAAADVELVEETTMPSGSGASQTCSPVEKSTAGYMETENASSASNDKDSYLSSQNHSLVDLFLASLDENCRQLLDDPSLEKSQVLMDAMLSVAGVYSEVHTLLGSYERGKTKRRESELSKGLKEFYTKRNELKLLVLEAVQVKIDPALGLHILKSNAERKEHLCKGIAITCLSFKSFIKDKGIKRSLQRRVGQIDKIERKNFPGHSNSERTTMVCLNNSKLTWNEAFFNLTRDVNSYDMDVYNIGILIQDSSIIRVKEHLSQVKGSSKETNKFIKSLLAAYPLMFMKNVKGEEFIINLHQTSNGGDEISELMYGSHEKDDEESCTASPTNTAPDTSEKSQTTTGSKPGRKSTVEKFPTIPDVATEFIKRNGFKAQEKRRNDDFVSCGVSLEEVRQQLLKSIPGLSEYGLSKNTVRYLFKPVHRSRNSSKLYKRLVDCRVPQKDNSGRPSDENSHYLHSRVNMRLEQAFLFEDEHIVFSADAMNKINVGNVLCVSRYHQIRRLFMVEDKVKVNDHDFPQGYKLIPCGKMPLLKPGVYLQDIFGDAVNSQMGSDDGQADIYEHDDIQEDTGYDTDGCVTDNTDQEERQETSQETDESIPHKSSVEFKSDKLGRSHVKFPRTGPVLVYNRNGQFHSQTMEAHANDFLPLMTNAVKGGRSCIVCVVDNGPDMNPTNYVNEFNLGNLWKDSGADMLIVTSYAAGQSAYNMIEHAWSPLSNRLTSVMLPAVLPGEDKPPNKQSNLTTAERESKEKLMLDNAADMLAKYWDCCTFDGHPVVPITVPSDEEKTYDEHNEILRFVGASLKLFHTDKKLQELRKTFKYYAKHAVRRENEFVLMKCQFFLQPGLECKYCQKNPPTATQTLQFMKKFKGKFMQPIESTSHPGHFMTFLEMIKLTDFPREEIRGDLGKCMICPSWVFSTVTEQERHRKLFHPDTKVKDVVPTESQKHKCTFKINDKICGEIFKSHHLLWKHKIALSHKKNRSEVARKHALETEKRATKQGKEKSIAKKVAGQRCITNCFNAEKDEDENTEEEEGDDDNDGSEESEEDVEEVGNDSEESEEDVEEVDNDDCNARPCKIDSVISKSKQNVEWVQCRLCPKWFHQYCVSVEEGNAYLFQCGAHNE